MSSSSSLPIKKVDLFTPSLAEVANTLNDGLKKYFAEVSVAVVDSPDFTAAPYHLAATGISGKPAVADIGGVDYLSPLPRLEKAPYSLLSISKELGYKNGHILGAGAAPFGETKGNCELMPNFYYESNEAGKATVKQNTHCARVNDEGGCQLFTLDSTNTCLLANVLITEGLPGKVLKIVVKKRIAEPNFTTTIRDILREAFGEKPVSLGGVFLINSGKAKLHVMPDFSKTPLNTDAEVNQWLKFYEMNPILICLSVLHSYDPGLNLRIEHTHCFSKHGEGGHYHYDVTPDIVEYEGYFTVAESLYRVDAP